VSPARRRACVEHVVRELGVSERKACAVLGQHRSTQRKLPRGSDDEAALRADIVELAKRYGRYGYRRITALLRDAGWSVNRKRVERIWRREGLKVPQRQPKRGRLWLADGSCVRLRPERANHVWAYDFVEDRTRDGRKFRMLCVVDEFTREALAIRVARKLSSSDVIDTLADLFIARGASTHIRSDQGPEFVAKAVKGWIEGVGAKTAYIEKASPWENGYVESFNGKLRDELLKGEVFNTLREAQVLIEEWRRHYNRVRPHSSLGYRPPAPETVPSARSPSSLAAGAGAAAIAHQNSARTTRWGLVRRTSPAQSG
jgi:putative transposase